MKAVFLRPRHAILLILAVTGIAAAITAALLWKQFHPRTVPLEKVLWTATPDAKVFFGPGTPPSLALAGRLRRMKADGYNPGPLVFPPDCPLFISPALFTTNSRKNNILILAPFSPAAARKIREEAAAKTTDGK